MKKKLVSLIVAASVASAFAPVMAEPKSQDVTVTTSSPDNVYLPALPTPKDVRPGVRDGMASKFPLSDDEIRWIRQQTEKNQYATYAGPDLKPDSRILLTSVDPGSAPPTIHVMPGYVTAISVVGDDGTPWPVVTTDMGAGRQFTIGTPAQAAGKTGGNQDGSKGMTNGAPTNLITIQPKFFGSSTNVILTLKGLDVPVILVARSGKPDGKEVDGRVVLRINRAAPDSPPPIMTPPPPSPVDSDLIQFIENTPPKDAVPVPVKSTLASVWRWGGGIVVRTRSRMILPSWIAFVKQDGWNVYQLPQTDFIRLLTDSSGDQTQITLNGGQ